MPSGKTIPKKQWLQYLKARDEGFSLSAACAQVGISKEPASRCEKGYGTDEYKLAMLEFELIKPEAAGVVSPNELTPIARAALKDIELFARRYFGLDLMPYQIEHCMKVMELLQTEEEEYLVINMPPGTGKSTVFTKVLPAFATCNDRTIRGQIGSLNSRLANQYVRALRTEFERDIPLQPTLKEERLGLARSAEACMRHDYGPFKPLLVSGSEMWQADQFVVRQAEGMPIRDKEPTWAALSRDGGMIGMRADLVIWDDVYDVTKHSTPEARRSLFDWFDSTAVTRLEPGGLFVLQGQRLGPADIYRHALDIEIEVDPEDPDEDLSDLGLREEGGKFYKYHHVISPAHHDELCAGDHGKGAKPWPGGCLLFPARLGWRKLRAEQKRDPNTYETVYQQKDSAPGLNLVQRVWIEGGEDLDGVRHPGAYDEDRALWEPPTGVDRGLLLGVMTVDPSPTKFWALQAWAVQRHNETGGDTLHLLDSERVKMEGPGLLDWSIEKSGLIGWIPDWHMKFQRAGIPLEYVIVEVNVAQRWLTQTRAADEFTKKHQVFFMRHTTGHNKSDPSLGVPVLQGYYRGARVRLPGLSEADRLKSKPLVDEICAWNSEGTYGGTDDQVMANWFLVHKMRGLPMLPRRAEDRSIRQSRPSFVQGGRRGLYG